MARWNSSNTTCQACGVVFGSSDAATWCGECSRKRDDILAARRMLGKSATAQRWAALLGLEDPAQELPATQYLHGLLDVKEGSTPGHLCPRCTEGIKSEHVGSHSKVYDRRGKLRRRECSICGQRWRTIEVFNGLIEETRK